MPCCMGPCGAFLSTEEWNEHDERTCAPVAPTRVEEAPKFDAGKPRLDLVSGDFLRALGQVLGFGAEKYGAWTWARGKDWSKDYASVQRHLTLWHDGEDLDPESGLPHLAHAATDVMFLLVSQLRGLGRDDRPVWDKKGK